VILHWFDDFEDDAFTEAISLTIINEPIEGVVMLGDLEYSPWDEYQVSISSPLNNAALATGGDLNTEARDDTVVSTNIKEV